MQSRPAIALALALACAGCGLRPPPPGMVADARMDLPCLPVTGIAGAEDITVHPGTGFAYASSTDRRAVMHGDEPSAPDGRVGHIYRLDLRAHPPRVRDVTPPALREGGAFQPHGIGLLPRPDGSARLFVISHRPTRDRKTGRWSRDGERHVVEVLEIAAGGAEDEPLRHAGTIAGDAHLPSPNDIAPVGERRFFVTNEHGPGSPTTVQVNDLFGLNYGSLAYFDGSGFRTVVPHLPFANGVNALGDRLYVASSSRGTVTTLRWTPGGEVTEVASTRLGSAVDNIEVAPGPRRALLVAAHPEPARLALHAKRWLGVRSAPSQVIRLRLGPDGVPTDAATILRLDGVETREGGLSAASVAAAHATGLGEEMRLVLGPIFSDRVLVCTIQRLP